MRNSNYPTAQLNEVDPTEVNETIHSLMELRDRGKPQTDDELRQRIDDFFTFCWQSSVRPGVESLCMSIGITRSTLYRWSKGIDCGAERQEIIQAAQGVIHAFLEQCFLSGKVNPATGIFLLKNWCNYKDVVSLEDNTPNAETKRVLTAAELPKLGD